MQSFRNASALADVNSLTTPLRGVPFIIIAFVLFLSLATLILIGSK